MKTSFFTNIIPQLLSRDQSAAMMQVRRAALNYSAVNG